MILEQDGPHTRGFLYLGLITKDSTVRMRVVVVVWLSAQLLFNVKNTSYFWRSSLRIFEIAHFDVLRLIPHCYRFIIGEEVTLIGCCRMLSLKGAPPCLFAPLLRNKHCVWPDDCYILLLFAAGFDRRANENLLQWKARDAPCQSCTRIKCWLWWKI